MHGSTSNPVNPLQAGVDDQSSQSEHEYINLIIFIASREKKLTEVVTFGTAVPASQFVPGIMIGSTYGQLVGMFVVKLYKRTNIKEGTQVNMFDL
ncbi:chloride channel protein CLC-d [Tanacetum coccineum]